VTFKPLLAHTIDDTAKVQYPVLVSVKLDGIRCLIIDGVAMTRSLKPIRNEYVQSLLGREEYNGLDGELIVGDIFAKDCYRVTNSCVMSKDGKPDFKYHVFDSWDATFLDFEQRLKCIQETAPTFGSEIVVVQHLVAGNESELLKIEADILEAGGEGVMVRSMDGRYKNGRSTMKEGILGKLKRFVDEEFVVVGFEERMHNGNEATTNALGHTERSSHRENKIGRGDLGALVLRTQDGLEFTCGTGFDDNLRKGVWDNPEVYLGKLAKIKHFAIGTKDLPRFPVFLGFRDASDI
jgi:DNA ligase-1